MRCIKVLLVDDHAVVRAGYRSLLEQQEHIDVVADVASAREAYETSKSLDVDIVVIDLSMPRESGLNAIQRIKRQDPETQILVFTMHLHSGWAKQAFAAGASAYVTKSSDPETLVRAIDELAAGRQYLSADIARELAAEKIGERAESFENLSVREFEILTLLLDGHKVREIASNLCISEKRVRNVHYSIKSKLGATDDIDLVRLCHRFDMTKLLDE